MRSSSLCSTIALTMWLSCSTSISAAPEVDAVQKAIKRATTFLKNIHQPAANYRGGSHVTGTAPLAGLALLEAGVPQDDPVMKNIVAFVREHALDQTETYHLSLTILFLDRLGNPADRPIIQLLGVRLLAGQEPSGGWSYQCGHPLTNADEARLKKVFATEAKLVNRPMGKNEPKKVEAAPKPNDDKPELHPEVAKWAKLVNQMEARERFAGGRGGEGDNSNTQFAVLGVWVARKHGVPCDAVIAAFEKRFRLSQDADGGWGYKANQRGSTPAMTCAGLLALAVSHGAMENALRNNGNPAAVRPKGMAAPADDLAIKAGLKCLGNYITIAKGEPPDGIVNQAKKKGKRFKADELNSNLYFLWSLERVAMLYGLETIGHHDWYVWGADALVDTQQANGCWTTKGYAGANAEVNTSFALLFLSRASIARDLTAVLKGKVKDPGVAVLRGGTDVGKLLPMRDPNNSEPKANIDSPRPEAKANVEPPKLVPAPTPVDSATLVKALLAAVDDRERQQLVAKYRDEKGAAYTEALATAAKKWTGDAQRDVRDALASRLTRMTVATLKKMLTDEEREIRRAAATACGMKEAKECVPELIESLRDSEEMVVQAARTSLKRLTEQDFGPNANAGAGEKLKALLAWRNWWKEQMR